MHWRPASTATALVVLSVFAGCAASGGGDSDEPGEEPTTAETTQTDGGSRPTFDASLDAAAPDDAGSNDASPPDIGDCNDNADPGNSENVAKQLANQDDCDNGVKTVSGIVKGAVDVDFYKLTITDKFGCSIDTDFQTSTSGIEMCVFLKCVNGNPIDLKGCGNGTPKTSDIGMKGCCASGPGKPSPDWSCSSGLDFNDSADIFVRIKQPGIACLPYTFTYRF